MTRTLLVAGLAAVILAFAGCGSDGESPDSPAYDLAGAWAPAAPAECSGNLPEDDLRAMERDILGETPLLIEQTDGDLRIRIVGGPPAPPLEATLSGNRAHWQQESADGVTVWTGAVLSEDRIALTQRTEMTGPAGFELRLHCAFDAVRLEPPAVARLQPGAWNPPPAPHEAVVLADRILRREGDRLLLDAERRDALAAELRRVLSQVREVSPQAADAPVRAAYVFGKLLVALRPALFETLSQRLVPGGDGLQTGQAEFDALNARLGLSAVVWRFPDYRMLDFHFDGYLNVPLAAEAYQDLEGVEFAEPDALVGDGSDIDALRSEDTGAWHVIVRRAWGDCPAGCVNEAFSFFIVDADGAEQVNRSRAAGDPAFEELADSRGWPIHGEPDMMPGTVVIDDGTAGRPPQSDPFKLQGVRITGDTLEAVVSYGGGCREHRFTLVAAGFFRATDPLSLPVSLVHDAAGDPCEAYLTATYAFDLTPIRNLYGGGEGTIVLLLDGAPDLVYEIAAHH